MSFVGLDAAATESAAESDLVSILADRARSYTEVAEKSIQEAEEVLRYFVSRTAQRSLLCFRSFSLLMNRGQIEWESGTRGRPRPTHAPERGLVIVYTYMTVPLG
jgi:hypothetical protein